MSDEEKLIIPPPNIRKVIDKAIGLVERGNTEKVELQQYFLNAQPNLFSFLDTHDPYHAWYKWRQSNPTIELETQPSSEHGVPPTSMPDLEPLEFCYHQPPISSQMLAIIKLCAQFASHNETIELELAQQNNPLLEFLTRKGQLHDLYSQFRDQYKRINEPIFIEKLLERCKRENILDRAWRRSLEKPKPKQERPDSQESRFQVVDWQDFEVVETVEFLRSDQTASLRSPFSKREILHGKIDIESVPSRAQRAQKETTLLSPFTGEQIPASQYDQHIRIHSLDPGWHQKQEKQLKQQQLTNLDMDEAAANLKRLASGVDTDQPQTRTQPRSKPRKRRKT